MNINSENKVSVDVARVELERWFKACKFKDRKIEANRDNEGGASLEDMLTEAICDGLVVINEEGVLTQKLEFPFKNGKDSLTFKARIHVRDVRNASKGIQPNDRHGSIVATVAARTGENKGLIDEMDLSDFDVTSAIISYFL